MKFEALRSPKQLFSYKGALYKAINWCFITEDKEVADFLRKNPFWKEVEVAKKIEAEKKKPECKKTYKKGEIDE